MAHKIGFVRKKSLKIRTYVRVKNYAIVLSPNIFELAPFWQYFWNSLQLFVLFNIYFPNLKSFQQNIFIIIYSSHNNIDCKLLITKNKYKTRKQKNPYFINIGVIYSIHSCENA